ARNNSNDKGYREFVSPIIERIKKDFSSTHSGLDFGSGKDSSILKILKESNYNIRPYDPFFIDETSLLEQHYDYITCCEVIEHFHHPKKEFALLKNLLKQKGKLYCMTHIYSPDINFETWYYKNDPTHVFIYQNKTFEWIKNEFGFSDIKIHNRLITFSN
ncbi:MAG: class I SAM-dependent methyltransferase, partial [Bacteroidia bacterium]